MKDAIDIIDAIKNRHSVREYLDKSIEEGVAKSLQKEIDACNEESGLNIQLVLNEPNAFDGNATHYGRFKGVKNYIALVGKKGKDLHEKIGYYGERIAVMAGVLGLNTCWVALTYRKYKAVVNVADDESLVCVLALGYGVSQGIARRSKTLGQVSNICDGSPEWFKRGLELSLLAPTAINQQQFFIELRADSKVHAKAKIGFYNKVDLGIVKYHFEVGAGRENFEWV